MSTDRNRVEEKDTNKSTDRNKNKAEEKDTTMATGRDRMPKHKERLAKDNAELENKLTEKQSPADTDKGGLSGKTSSEGGQRANVSTAGAQERQSVNEFASAKDASRKEKRNQPDIKKD